MIRAKLVPQIILFIFLLVLGYLLYTNLGRDALFDWDEGIYGELGRSLTMGHNWLFPSWNNAVWLEKPPGIAWATGLGIFLLGPTAHGARFLMPLFALYTLYVVYRLGTKLGSWRHGLLAVGVLAGFNLFLGRTRAVNTDMALLASITTTILFLLENRPAWWVALSIFGGVWFKGLAGFISLIIALPLFLQKSKPYLLRLLIYLLVATLPWHILAYFKYGQDFLTPYFFEQVLKRATTQIEFHFETRYYYFNYLSENLGAGVLIVAGFGALLTLISRKNRFLVWWVLAPLAIFTLAKTRLFWYILPIYPALSLLISQAIGAFVDKPKLKPILTILCLGILGQALLTASSSVELSKSQAKSPDRVAVAQALHNSGATQLHVLVPESERLSEALLPQVARLSSSFRYGGMPSVVYYFQNPVYFYYNVDHFIKYWDSTKAPLAMIHRKDLTLLGSPHTIVVETTDYLGISKGVYAQH